VTQRRAAGTKRGEDRPQLLYISRRKNWLRRGQPAIGVGQGSAVTTGPTCPSRPADYRTATRRDPARAPAAIGVDRQRRGAAISCLWLGYRIGGIAAALAGAANADHPWRLVVVPAPATAELAAPQPERKRRCRTRRRASARWSTICRGWCSSASRRPRARRSIASSAAASTIISHHPGRGRRQSGRLLTRFDRRAVRDWVEALAQKPQPGEAFAREFEITDPAGQAR